MDPVLQRFGDVTIQRLEKPKDPKVGPQNEASSMEKDKEEAPTSSEEESFDEYDDEFPPQGVKRHLPSVQGAVKKFKFDKSGDITLEKKISPVINDKVVRDINSEIGLSNFSDTEISDYDSETDIESDSELLPGEIPLKERVKEPSEDEEDLDNSTSFLEKLVEEPFLESEPSTVAKPPPEPNITDQEDYDYDIKEKLKEMGEISFETVKKGEKPKKAEVAVENEVSVTRKFGTIDEETAERLKASGVNMRRNIREVMDETKLDEATLAAQRLEAERLSRVQEQQKLIRELQKQAAQERMQQKVLQLLQGNNIPKPGSSGTRIGNTVLVKLPNGQTKPMTRLPKKPIELLKMQKQPPLVFPSTSKALLPNRKPGGNLTPSVSIAPVAKKPVHPLAQKSQSDTESDTEDNKQAGPKEKGKSKDDPKTPIEVSSDDDCIVVSESEAEPGVDEPDEDPSNSGMHTNDEFNQPDEQGRVLVNVGHPEEESDIFVAPQISRIIKPHQIGGVRFLYDNVVESTSRYASSPGFGCILAHSMGLGKTLQVVCFSDIFLRHTPAKTILCIMPINTLQNWLAEYNMWLPTEEAAANSPLMAHGEVRPRNFNLHVLNDSHKTLVARSRVIHEWRGKGGVLLIGYEQFRLLSLRKHPKPRKKPGQVQPLVEDDKTRLLFNDIHEALVCPGPDLVICDEGHRIKNSHASISLALKQMQTKRRVVLTGYPLQNNLMEYWCMVDFVRPNYLGTKIEFCNMFERPIMNGQCIDSTDADIKLMRYRAHVLHSLLVGFVQRRSHMVLQTALPQKEEYVLLVKMTSFQRMLYETFMNEVVRIQAVPNPLKAFAVCCKIWNHPDVLYNFLKKRAGGEAVDIDLEEVASTTGAASPSESKVKKPPPKPKRTPAKGKAAGKPAASVTPYNSTAEAQSAPENQKTPTKTPFSIATAGTPKSENISNNFSPSSNSSFNNESFNQNPSFFDLDQTNSQFPPSYTSKAFPNGNQTQSTSFSGNVPSSSNFNCTSTSQTDSFGGGITPISSVSTPPHSGSGNLLELGPPASSTSGFVSNAQSRSNDSSFNNSPLPNFENFNQSSYQQRSNYQQNFWGQQSENYNQQNDYFNACGQPYNPNFSSSNANQTWVKKEEKSFSISSPLKSETSNDSKPKINIISDIKLPPFTLPEKKINIISDIKIEPKLEPLDEKMELKLEPDIVKNEIKSEDKDKIDDKLPDKSILEPPLSKLSFRDSKEDSGIPYDWAVELLQDYIPGCIENGAKMQVLFSIIEESISLGDRLLVFSQSLITLDLIEQFLQTSVIPEDTQKWARNTSYYRLDGSTSALEREKLINEFNSNPKIYLFLVSTRAGSLGINLVGANRVVVLDASWNPCHDTQAVCRVYRYGQRKPCFVYRLVVDNCLEKKIYDRQINKQGMSDRVVDECNPDAHLTMKDASTLCWDDKTDEGEEKDWSCVKDRYIDVVLQRVLENHGRSFTKEPFQHESLLVDRKEKQLSQQEKRLAKKGYEREKQAARQPAYNMASGQRGARPIASVRPMQQGERPSRWIPAEHWQRQGMTAQEMTLPLDVVIPTHHPDKGNIILKAGQKVLVLKSPKGVYMQLESGKIVAIKTAVKVKGKAEDNNDPTKMMKPSPAIPQSVKMNPSLSVIPQKRPIKPPFSPAMASKMNMKSVRQNIPNLAAHLKNVRKVQTAKARPYNIGSEMIKGPQGEPLHIPRNQSSDDEASTSEMHAKAVAPSNAPSSPDEEQFVENKEINKKISQLKKQISIQRVSSTSAAKQTAKPPLSSALEQLEHTTSSVMSEHNLPFQDTLDSITNSYKDDGLEDDESITSSDAKFAQSAGSDLSDHSDEVTYVSDQPVPQPQQYPAGQSADQPKQEPVSTGEYSYNYPNYNYQPYPQHPPPQGYGYPPQPPAYDPNLMGGYGQQPPPPPPPPQYNYGYQGYAPQPHYPPQGYDYNAPPPPQPIYPPYHAPPPYPPQQYAAPPQGMYPPPAAAPPPAYQDYQYPQLNTTQVPPAQGYYPST